MELIKKTISFSSLRDKQTPLVYELLTKSMISGSGEKSCCKGLNNRDVVLQNAAHFNQNWGAIGQYINIKVFLTQNMDDMGIFTDQEAVKTVPNYTLITTLYPSFVPSSPLLGSFSDHSIRYFARFNTQTALSFYAAGGFIKALTDDKLFSVTTYVTSTPLIQGLNLSIYSNYFVGVDVGGLQSNYTAYTIDALVTNLAGTGLHYKTYNYNRAVYNATVDAYFYMPYTEVTYQSEGWNASNTTLSAITKQEIYFGIVFPPKVENNVFIDRGSVSVFERHSRLRSLLSINQLELYGNGYYNLVKN